MWLWMIAQTVAGACGGEDVLRSAHWEQQIPWVVPGQEAAAALGRLVERGNDERIAAGLPPLEYHGDDPDDRYLDHLIVGLIDAVDTRGPDGELLGDGKDVEIFLATYAEVGKGSNDWIIYFFTDPSRTNRAVIEAGVPGRLSACKRKKRGTGTTDEAFELELECKAEALEIEVEVQWSDADPHSFFGPYPALEGAVAYSVDVGYDACPARRFSLYNRIGGGFYLPDPDRFVLRGDTADPDLEALLNDPSNQLDFLYDLQRTVRFVAAD